MGGWAPAGVDLARFPNREVAAAPSLSLSLGGGELSKGGGTAGEDKKQDEGNLDFS